MPLDEREKRYLAWLAKWDQETVDVLGGLMRRARAASTAGMQPPSEKGQVK
jgi:hypothetical protein